MPDKVFGRGEEAGWHPAQRGKENNVHSTCLGAGASHGRDWKLDIFVHRAEAGKHR